MRIEINTLKQRLGTLLLAAGLLLGISVSAQAQRRHGPPPWAPANGRRYDRPYGETVSARVHERNEFRRELRRDQRYQRRALNNRLRAERQVFGNTPSWRYQRRAERQDLRLLQRNERSTINRRWGNNREWRH